MKIFSRETTNTRVRFFLFGKKKFSCPLSKTAKEKARLEEEKARLEEEKARLEEEKARLEEEKARLEEEVYKLIQHNYSKKLEDIKRRIGKEKIRIGFLVNEPAKWQYQSLYEELESSEYFEPIVLVTAFSPPLEHYKTYEETLSSFQSLGLRTEEAYDTQEHKFLPLSQFNVDIVFYPQPWVLDQLQHPLEVSKYALTCYVPYSFSVVQHPIHYMRQFHRLLWKMFINDDMHMDELSSVVNYPITNCHSVGYPKLDIYFKSCPAIDNDKKIVIYAPHHSFEKGSLELSTFHHNAHDILKMAQKYQEDIYWIFKPHPALKHRAVTCGLMTEEEIDAYYASWAELGEIYEGGSYFPLFRNSSALITDCGSFLAEYLPAGKPLFHLWSPSAPYNQTVRDLSTSFYKIEEFSQLEKEFIRVVLKEDDYKREERQAKVRRLYDPAEKASVKIMRFLTEALHSLN